MDGSEGEGGVAAEMSVMSPAAPPLSFVMMLNVTVGAPVEIGTVARGRRRVIPIVGGRFEGPQLRGRVLPDGADWQIVRADMFTELDARYVLETDDGSRITCKTPAFGTRLQT